MKDLAELVELNRFVGREFLLWLWFESEVFETNLKPSGADSLSLWLETQITLASEGEEIRVKGATPGLAPEAKQALRQGKLPRDARLRAVLSELEYGWTFKADDLAIAGLGVPAQLKSKSDDDKYEVLYERMRLVEILEAALEGLFTDFLDLRLDAAWENKLVPIFKQWARGKAVDVSAYEALKRSKLGRRATKKRAS